MNNSNYDISNIDVTLNIQSNVNYPTTINILGNPFNPLDTSNATTQYRWNLTGFNFTNENKLTLEYRQSSATIFSVYYTTIFALNVNGVVSALNSLGIGFFTSYVDSGNTYITTYNQNFVFGLLNIFNPSTITPPPSAIFKGTMSGTSGSVNVWVNASANTYGVPPSFDIAIPLPVTSSDTIRINGVASNSATKKVAYIINLTTGVSAYYVNLNVGDSFNSGNIPVGNNSWELGYIDF
jgi:hypothetical protein